MRDGKSLLTPALRCTAAVLLACLLPQAPAQSATPVPKLDISRFIGPWYDLARYPVRSQKACVSDELVLYNVSDKKNSFDMVTSCRMKQDNWNWWDRSGRFDPAGSGRLRLSWYWLLHTPYLVLATDPNYAWALVGTPNHKSLWILSKSLTLPPATLAAIKAQASAQGFDPARLISIPQDGDTASAHTPAAPAPAAP